MRRTNIQTVLIQKRSRHADGRLRHRQPTDGRQRDVVAVQVHHGFLIGIGPIVILALIFDQTKDLFKKWLFYVIGTLFSMSMLSVVTAMVLKFTAKVAAAYWVVKFIPWPVPKASPARPCSKAASA
ncbi:hypothetical protein FHY12_001314 [Xanthomonas arboricola]|nr:hypothetical protein [Xanthomonas euroxanthea]